VPSTFVSTALGIQQTLSLISTHLSLLHHNKLFLFHLPSSSLFIGDQHHASTNGCHHPLLICHPIKIAPRRPIFAGISSLSSITRDTLFATLPTLSLACILISHLFFGCDCAPFELSSSIETSSQEHRSSSAAVTLHTTSTCSFVNTSTLAAGTHYCSCFTHNNGFSSSSHPLQVSTQS
jgi:hypothetical protein